MRAKNRMAVPPNSFKVHSIWSTDQTVVNTFYGVVDVPIVHIFTGELLLWDTEKYSGSKTIQKYNNLKGGYVYFGCVVDDKCGMKNATCPFHIHCAYLPGNKLKIIKLNMAHSKVACSGVFKRRRK